MILAASSVVEKFGELEKIELIVKLDSDTIKHKFIVPSIPLHPHNNTIQIWLELGIIGIMQTSHRFITWELWQYNHIDDYELFTPHDSLEIRTIFTICVKIVFYATAFWSYHKFSRSNL